MTTKINKVDLSINTIKSLCSECIKNLTKKTNNKNDFIDLTKDKKVKCQLWGVF